MNGALECGTKERLKPSGRGGLCDGVCGEREGPGEEKVSQDKRSKVSQENGNIIYIYI